MLVFKLKLTIDAMDRATANRWRSPAEPRSMETIETDDYRTSTQPHHCRCWSV